MTAWVWIDERETLAIHDQLLAAHGGAAGVRDVGLLRSALARPRQVEAYRKKVDAAAPAAACTFGLVRNHPFIDGNKRFAFVVGALFLELNDARLEASEAAAAEAVQALAAGLMEEAAYASFLREPQGGGSEE